MWVNDPNYIYFKSQDFKETVLTNRLALFDLDETLITSKNGQNPATLHIDKDPTNYLYLFDKIKYFKIFQTLKSCGFVVGIITNQSRIYYKNCAILKKIEHILQDFQVNLGWKPYVIINITRLMLKPSSKSFELLTSFFNNFNVYHNVDYIYTVLDNELVVPNIFYVGFNKSFVNSINENLFSNNEIVKFIRAKDFFKSPDFQISFAKELIILLGNPSSGKSTLAYKYQQLDYEIAVNDILQDRKKMINFVKEKLKIGKSVVIDALNYNNESRAPYLELGRKYKYNIKFCWIIRDGRYYNSLRGSKEYGESNTVYSHTKPASEVTYNIYSSKFEAPNIKDGVIEYIY